MKSIIIFGTGDFGKNIYKQYKSKYNIVCFCDNDLQKQNTYLFDIKIISPQNIININYDEIFIASSYAEEIYTQLISTLPIDKNKIVKLYVNESKTQFYCLEKRKKTELFMLDIARSLDKNNISYYIDHGTLLGIIRDNNLIPWDSDIDFAVLIEDKEKIISLVEHFLVDYIHPDCETNNWSYQTLTNNIIIENVNHHVIVAIQISNNSDNEEDDISLELMFKYTKNAMIYWAVCGKHLSAPLSICFPTKQITYKGSLLSVPNDVNLYLEHLYGNWQIPVKNWTYDQYKNINK